MEPASGIDIQRQLERDGAVRCPAVLEAPDVGALIATLSTVSADQAGVRLTGLPGLASFLVAPGPIGSIVAGVLGIDARPVRAVLFDKTPQTNWKLGWHQDRTIVVRERIEVEGFGPWSRKAGLQHVAPPFEILERMITVRIHLDPVRADNAPLLIAPGSHRMGRIPVGQIGQVVTLCGKRACLADRGDVWLYSTPIVHASDAAATPNRRRVLQVDYAAVDLPEGLVWQGL